MSPSRSRPHVNRLSPAAAARAESVVTLALFVATCLVVTVVGYGTYGVGDFGMFHADARRWLETGMLYGSATGAPTNLNLPHVAIMFVPLGFLPEFFAWVVWQGTQLVLAVDLVRRVLPFAAGRQTPMLGVILAISPATLSQIAMGQLGWATAWLVTVAWLRHERSPSTSALWLGLAIAAKPFLLVVPGWWILRSRFKEAALALTVALSVTGLGAALLGVDVYREWALRVDAVTWQTLPLNWSIVGVLTRWEVGTVPIVLIWVGVGLAAGLVLLRTSTLDSRGWVVALGTSLLLAPLAWAYYAWILVGPTLAWLAAGDARREVRLTASLLWIPSAFSKFFPFSTLGVVALTVLAARPPRPFGRIQPG